MIPAEDTNGQERLDALLDLMKEPKPFEESETDETQAAIEQGYRNLLSAIREQ